MKNFNILGVHWKTCLLEGGVMKNQYRGGLPKRGGAWTVWRFKGETWQERGEGVLLREGGW